MAKALICLTSILSAHLCRVTTECMGGVARCSPSKAAQHIAARLDVFAQPRLGGVTDFGDE
ncbi:MAG: hypothetical protein U1E91_01585 [Moraxella sp.]